MNREPVFLVTAFLVLALTACGPTIGLKTDFKNANFEIGKTNRDNVIEHLGLPQRMLTDSEGRQHYFYDGSTRLVGACVGCGIANAPVGLVPSLINQAGVKNGAEYVFDSNQLLIAKFEPKATSTTQ
jgi:hypothetical protein